MFSSLHSTKHLQYAVRGQYKFVSDYGQYKWFSTVLDGTHWIIFALIGVVFALLFSTTVYQTWASSQHGYRCAAYQVLPYVSFAWQCLFLCEGLSVNLISKTDKIYSHSSNNPTSFTYMIIPLKGFELKIKHFPGLPHTCPRLRHHTELYRHMRFF